MISGLNSREKMAQRTNSIQWRVTLPPAISFQLSLIKRIGYFLSANRKNPSVEATTLKTATIPSQLEVPVKLSPTYLRPPNILVKSEKLKCALATTESGNIIIEPTPTIINIFCLSFILEFNTLTYIVIVTQIL